MDDVVAKKACEVAHDFPSYVELVLERMKDEKWGYCLADHDKRVIFWLEPYESKELIGNIRGVKATSLISKFFLSNFGSSHHVTARVCPRSTALVCMASKYASSLTRTTSMC